MSGGDRGSGQGVLESTQYRGNLIRPWFGFPGTVVSPMGYIGVIKQDAQEPISGTGSMRTGFMWSGWVVRLLFRMS